MHGVIMAMGKGAERLGQVMDITFLFQGRKSALDQMHAGKDMGGRMTCKACGFLHDGYNSLVGTAGKEDGVPTFFKQQVLFVAKGVMLLLVRSIKPTVAWRGVCFFPPEGSIKTPSQKCI